MAFPSSHDTLGAGREFAREARYVSIAVAPGLQFCVTPENLLLLPDL
jgi:hypothetical protein